MKKLLLAATALLLATASVNASVVTVEIGLQLDSGPITTFGPGTTTLTVSNQTVGDYSIQNVTGSGLGLLVPPQVLNTNTMEVDNLIATTSVLHIYVTIGNINSLSGLQEFTSGFDAVGMANGWSVTDSTFANNTNFPVFCGNALCATNELLSTATFNTPPASGQNFTHIFDVSPTLAPFSSYTAEYDISANGNLGQSNLGISLSAAPVPGPIVGAGLPGLMAACGGLLALARRRRQLVA
jgi:hypothetical protein